MVTNILYYLRRGFGWALVALAATGILWWGYAQTTQERTIRLATAAKSGGYYQFGMILKRHIEKQTPYEVQLLETSGSVDNRGLLLAGKADFAIVQTAAVSMQNLTAISPLWDDYVQVVVRKGSGIRSLYDVERRAIALGRKGSGYRANAMAVLDYYGIDTSGMRNTDAYFLELLANPQMDGAIVTTSLVNPDLRKVLASGNFELISIPTPDGFVVNNAWFRQAAIPSGVYRAPGAAAPAAPIPTLTTDAILAARADISAEMVEAILTALNSVDLRTEARSLVQRDQLEDPIWRLLPLHPAVERYLDPYAGFSLISDFLSTLARFKEVLVLALIGLFVGRYQWQRHRQTREDQHLRVARHEVERLFEKLVVIEQAQKEAKDVRLLQEHLAQVGSIKLRGLKAALGTDLQNSGLFTSFLEQAASVSREIEWRIALGAAPEPAAKPRQVA